MQTEPDNQATPAGAALFLVRKIEEAYKRDGILPAEATDYANWLLAAYACCLQTTYDPRDMAGVDPTRMKDIGTTTGASREDEPDDAYGH